MPLVRKTSETPSGKIIEKPVAELINDLSSSDLATRKLAAIALEDEESAVPAMVHRIKIEPDREIREALLLSLLRHPCREIAEEIFTLVREDDAGHRTLAVDALKQMPSNCTTFVKEHLQDDDPDIRLLAVNIILESDSEQAESLLLEQLVQEDDPNVVGTIAEALMMVGTEAALEPLAEAVDRFSSTPFIVFSLNAAIDLVRGRGLND